jgi:hypothetical protein
METTKPARATHRDRTMGKNLQPGRVVTLVAPTGGVLSGQAVQVGALFGIAAFDAIGGADVEVAQRRSQSSDAELFTNSGRDHSDLDNCP